MNRIRFLRPVLNVSWYASKYVQPEGMGYSQKTEAFRVGGGQYPQGHYIVPKRRCWDGQNGYQGVEGVLFGGLHSIAHMQYSI